MTPLFSRIGFPQIVGLVLLGAMVAAGAGTICLLPVSAPPLHSAGCHPSRVPANPQPADFRCCVSRHPSALPTNIFLPRPALLPLRDGRIAVLAARSSGNPSSTALAGSSSPPATPFSGSDSTTLSSFFIDACSRACCRSHTPFFLGNEAVVDRTFLSAIFPARLQLGYFGAGLGAGLIHERDADVNGGARSCRSCPRRTPGRERAGSLPPCRGRSGC